MTEPQPAAPSPSDALLAARLAEVEADVAALAKGGEAPSTEDLASVAGSGRIVDLFLSDIGEALRQVCVAGLSFPTPELPDTLAALGERARALGLLSSFETISRLRAYIAATLAEPDLERRHVHARGAWEQTQKLIAWQRLYRAEHDLLMVQSRLSAEASGEQLSRAEGFKTATLSVWPLGVDLSPTGKLLIFGRDIDQGRTVVLADHLAEHSAEDPLGAAAISRMFQDVIELRKVLGSVIRLEDHPVVERANSLLFRPAFKAVPKLRPVADKFKPPKLGPFDLSADAPPEGVGVLDVKVQRSSGRTRMTSGKESIDVQNPLLKLSFTKLMLREQTQSLDLRLVVVAHDDALQVLSTETELDGRVFPAHDTTVFRTSAALLQSRADHAPLAEGAVAHLFLRTAAHALGGSKPEQVGALKTQVADATARSLDEAYRLSLCFMLLGLPLPPERVRGFIEDAVLLLTTAASAIDLEVLARVLGRPSGSVSLADTREVDGAMAYRAVFMADQAGLFEELRPLFIALYNDLYKGELKNPQVGDVCARALLVAGLTDGKGEIATDADDEGDDGDDDEGKPRPAVEAALKFFNAHLDDFAPKKTTTKSKPLPEPIELLQLGDTLAYLQGAPRLGPTLLALRLPPFKLEQACVEALLEWLVVASPEPLSKRAVIAADNLLVSIARGFSSKLFADL